MKRGGRNPYFNKKRHVAVFSDGKKTVRLRGKDWEGGGDVMVGERRKTDAPSQRGGGKETNTFMAKKKKKGIVRLTRMVASL